MSNCKWPDCECADGEGCKEDRAALIARNAELEAENKALREDAERYRYLRDNCKREWQSDMAHNRGALSLDIEFEADGWDLDAAIDAARTPAAGNQP